MMGKDIKLEIPVSKLIGFNVSEVKRTEEQLIKLKFKLIVSSVDLSDPCAWDPFSACFRKCQINYPNVAVYATMRRHPSCPCSEGQTETQKKLF